jgi:hypothetical protein
MSVRTVATSPIEGQQPGTSGLRKKTQLFMQPGYLENFVQSLFDAVGGAIGGLTGKTLVLGGRVEVLRQPARRRAGDAVRRGELRHRLEPSAREGRAVGGVDGAEHPGRSAPAGGGDPSRHGLDPQVALARVVAAAGEIADISGHTGRDAPDVRT